VFLFFWNYSSCIRREKGSTLRRVLTILLLSTFLFGSFAFAQKPDDPATKEDVQKLFDLTGSRKTFDGIMGVMRQQLPALSESALQKSCPNATSKQKEEMSSHMLEEMDKMFRTMPYDELIAATMPSYQSHFTHGEIQELIRFYESPVGKKMIEEMPLIMSDAMTAMRPVLQNWMEKTTADLRASAEAFAKKLQKEQEAEIAPKS
jgi:hypothetical protein